MQDFSTFVSWPKTTNGAHVLEQRKIYIKREVVEAFELEEGRTFSDLNGVRVMSFSLGGVQNTGQ